MNNDLFYARISDKLSGQLDPELFERCAVDLLRRSYPTLVPIRGGDDAGMDGAVADGAGEPFPLVTTTSKETTRNLKHNLATYVQRVGQRRKAIFATSQVLNQRKRANLEKVARESGFTLVQIHDGADFADRLYRDARWCKKLLGLSGDPCPLSIVPRSERPLLNASVIGRDADIAWLRGAMGDKLLVGQPGSGKTFLLHQLAKEHWGLFVISRDRGEIAAGIRDQQPTVLIVDDVSPDEPILGDLRQLRETTCASFDIVATCWPRDEERIREVLRLPKSQVHTLGLLTREEIAQVIEGTGLRGTVPLMNELVGQADGRPGLAATLALVLMQGGWKEVISGNRLRVSLLGRLADDALPVLATFSLGGRRGLPQEKVAQALGKAVVDLWPTLRDCEAAGVLYDNYAYGQIAVGPPALRYDLVREVFFQNKASIVITPIIQAIGGLLDVSVLIGARARGAPVPDALIIPRLDQSPEHWLSYAWLGERETEWVLDYHPNRVNDVANPALHYAPDKALPLLLQMAIDDQRPLHSFPDAPLRLIHDWIKRARPGTGDVLARRKRLLQSVELWIDSGNNPRTGLRACEFVMSLDYEDIGIIDVHNSGTWTFGVVTLDETANIRGFWPTILGLYEATGCQYWEPLRNIIEHWAYPGRTQAVLSDAQYEEFRASAGVMLEDLVKISKDKLDILHWATLVAEHLHLDTELPLDVDFAVLYPHDPLEENYQAGMQRQRSTAEELATVWAEADVEWVAKRLAYYEATAAKMQHRGSRWSPYVCFRIAQSTSHPLAWSQALIALHVPGDVIIPFLQRAIDLCYAGWEQHVAACFADTYYVSSMVALVITLPAPPEYLLSLALCHATGHDGVVEGYCMRREVPEETVARLLTHPDPGVRRAAAYGEWVSQPKGDIRRSLVDSWRSVIVAVSGREFWLPQVFEQNPDIAFDWLQNHLRDLSTFPGRAEEDAIVSAIQSLEIDTRIVLLHNLPSSLKCLIVVSTLAESDLRVYRELLNDESLSKFHLVPLSGIPDELWTKKAKLALSKYGPHDIARATLTPITTEGISGNMSGYWEVRVRAFDKLVENPDGEISALARVGKMYAQKQYESELADERDEDIHGPIYDR